MYVCMYICMYVCHLQGFELLHIQLEASLLADLLTSLRQKKTVTLKEVQSLTGPLNFTWSVILLGRAFLRRLTDLPIGIQSPFHLPCFLFANTLSDSVESWLWSGVLERAFRMKQTIIIILFFCEILFNYAIQGKFITWIVKLHLKTDIVIHAILVLRPI